MHPLLVPALLMLAALNQKRGEVKQELRNIPTPMPPPQPRPQPSAAHLRVGPAKILAPKPKHARAMPAKQAAPAHSLNVEHAPEHPHVIPAPPEAQAAVDAAMSKVVAEMKQGTTPAPSPSQPVVPGTDEDDAHAAAKELLAFIIRTQKFGTEKERPPEIIALQKRMGMVLEAREAGIVGPKTRARARDLGVAIPKSPHPVARTKRR